MALLALAVIACCCYLFDGGDELVAAVSGEAKKPIYSVATEEKKIAFSFDATWGAEHTGNILDILRENEIKTTFFLVNIWLEEYPDMARLIHDEGHEIQLHSATHPHFPQLSSEAMAGELKENNVMIKEICGTEGSLFRPPFGDYDNAVIDTAHSLGLEVVQWSVDSLDWQDITAAEICNRVKNGVKPGSIVLFHNNGLHTAEAIAELVPYFKEQGYAIVPVSELIYKENYSIDINGVQSLN
ncbi:MAG: polysaccharide deacetylase family protein [Bacillota bacterium]|nr:polysaccharide deacetylase family protein [Bacillota bacterium]